MRRADLALGFSLALTSAALGCSTDEAASTEPSANGSGGSAATNSGGGTVASAGAGLAAGGSSGTASSAGGSSGVAGLGAGGSGAVTVDFALQALAANRSVGLEWTPVPDATAYKLYFAEGSAATPSSSSIEIDATRATYVHRALTNGTTYHYAIAAVVGGSESAPSPDISATPSGEWALEEFGSGLFEDLATGELVPRVPLEERVQILIFAEGYTDADLGTFHDDGDHDGARDGDVDGWIDEVFAIEPYASYREAFVIWTLPRASNTHFDGGDTAFAVPTISGTYLATDTIAADGETATRAWSAIAELSVAPGDFSGGGFGSLRTHVAAFLLYDPVLERAALSGRTLALRNPDDGSQRIDAAFGVGHAHEFTHAFSAVRDEYIENENPPVSGWDELDNVVGTNVCGELPWSHLLQGSEFNPDQGDLVGAFGVDAHGFHSELLCLMNGTHDNAEYYGGNGLLRSNDRLCNYCRELTAFRIYSRSAVLENGTAGFEQWKANYRAKFYERFPFAVPATVPQTNNLGTSYYESCVAALQASQSRSDPAPSGPVVYGCVTEEP